MRFYELEPLDVICDRGGSPEYVVLMSDGRNLKLLSVLEGRIFDYPGATAHVELYGYSVLRDGEVVT